MRSSSKKVNEFYKKTIEDFEKKLEHKFSNKEQGFDFDVIDQIITVNVLWM